jgi:hypothetical protein
MTIFNNFNKFVSFTISNTYKRKYAGWPYDILICWALRIEQHLMMANMGRNM